MSRRTRAAAEAAAAQASEAAKALAQSGQEVKQEADVAEPKPEGSTSPDRIEKLLANRPSVQARDEILSKLGIEDEVKEPEVKEEVKPVEAPKVEEVKAEGSPVEPPKTIKVKVDGEEIEASQEDVDAAGGVAAYRMHKASENRLKEAREAKEESKKLMAALSTLLQERTPKQEPAKPEDINKLIAQKLQTVRFGSDDEGAAAMREIVEKMAPKQHDPNVILTAAVNRLKWEQAMESFVREFPEVKANPLLGKLANALDTEARSQIKQGQVVDWINHYRTIGNQIRSIVPAGQSQSAAVPTTADTSSQQSDKEARKASIVNLPQAAARAELPKEEKEPTAEELRAQWIRDSKKVRGQA